MISGSRRRWRVSISGLVFIILVFSLLPMRAALSVAEPDTAICQYDPDDPLVGCWLIINVDGRKPPFASVLNIHRDGRAYFDTLEELTSGATTSRHRIERAAGIFYLENKSWIASWLGPYFSDQCSVMLLRPFAGQTETFMGWRLSVETLTDDLFHDRNPLNPTEFLSEDDPPSSGCEDNTEETPDEKLAGLLLLLTRP